jgi:hypothetical protein
VSIACSKIGKVPESVGERERTKDKQCRVKFKTSELKIGN